MLAEIRRRDLEIYRHEAISSFLVNFPRHRSRCFVPALDGALLSTEWKEALWAGGGHSRRFRGAGRVDMLFGEGIPVA